MFLKVKQNKNLKFVFIQILFAGLSFASAAQSLILRPGLGFRYFKLKPDYSAPHYFDPSFNGKYKYAEQAATIAAELLYAKHSYELTFTSQHVGIHAFYTSYSQVGGTQLIGSTGLSQFQFIYNRFFEIKNKRLKRFSPYVGIGPGIGFNRPNWVYADTDFSVFTLYNNNLSEFIDVDIRSRSLAKLSYSLVFKTGVAVKIKNIERARLSAVYNLGLNKIGATNIKYAHTNTKYYGTSYSKGTQFSLILTAPIYIKRKK